MNFATHRLLLSRVLWKPRNFKVRNLSSGDELNVYKCGPITMIGLNRADKKNCFTVKMMEGLKEEVKRFENDDSSNAAVLYGERGNFSSGLDEEELKEDPDLLVKIENVGLFDFFCQKPIVAAVSGYAVGIGFDVALWCDFIVVEDTAILASYNRKNSSEPMSEERIIRLHSILGLRKTLDWVITGRMVKAKEAMDCGVASRIVACGTGLGQGMSFASSLNNMHQQSLKADRALIYSLSDRFTPSVKKEIIKERQFLISTS